MDYERIYRELMSARKSCEEALRASGEYYNDHHIVPRSLGGTDARDNLVSLTVEDHIHAHLLLAKIHGGRMWGAVVALLGKYGKSGYIPGKLERKAAALAYQQWGESLRGPNNPFYGKTHSEEFRLKQSDLTVYRLKHKEGAEIYGTQKELIKQLKGTQSTINGIIRGHRKTWKGWYNPALTESYKTSEEYVRDSWRAKQEKVTLYHFDGRVWSGAPVDFEDNFSKFSCGYTCVKGWYLTKEGAETHFERQRRFRGANSAKRGDISGSNNPMAGTSRRAVWLLKLRHTDGRTFEGLSTDFADSNEVTTAKCGYQAMIKTFRGKLKANGRIVKSWRGWSALSVVKTTESEYARIHPTIAATSNAGSELNSPKSALT
jgi:hypothetical protein